MFPTASEIGNHPSTFHKKVPLGLKLKDSRKKKENRVDLSISLTLPCISNLLKAHFFGSSSFLFLETILGLSQFIRPSFIFSLSTSLFLLTTFNNFNFTEHIVLNIFNSLYIWKLHLLPFSIYHNIVSHCMFFSSFILCGNINCVNLYLRLALWSL